MLARECGCHLEICVYNTAIECPVLSLTNGGVTYVVDTTAEFEIRTIATHTCNASFALVGDMTRTCADDDQLDIIGVWSGSPPSCERKKIWFCCIC